MFYKFNAHRARKPAEKADYKLAGQIFQKLITLQRCWASYMGSRAEKLTYGWLKALCVTVITVSSTYCAYLIFEGFISLNKTGTSARQGHIWAFDPFGIKEQLRAQTELNNYLDSLENAVLKDSLNQLNHTPK
ncbi:hypothetical protein [Dyadobacter diqingensis]|uniref:hypothetical protein n=1 Tax=Dyadobacter diqingensis TaxID=2938121 RepID=UPI0020C1A406|nr:hypothetical protein [Dyadobacter diqingensis]